MTDTDLRLSIVFGYLPNIDRIDRRARAAGLTDRLALVLHTYRPDASDMVFDLQLAAALVAACSVAIEHDSELIELSSGHRASSFDEWKREELSSAEPAPFSRARLAQAGKMVGVWVYQPYDAVGGPAPYHDAVVLELFATGASLIAVRQLLYDTLLSLKVEPTEIQGRSSQHISPLSLLKRLL